MVDDKQGFFAVPSADRFPGRARPQAGLNNVPSLSRPHLFAGD